MKAYIYCAALLCECCGKAKQTELDRIATEHGNVNYNYREDSDKYPQGPYADGGGEADTPQHCDSCGIFLENVLTDDGATYVKTLAMPFETRPNMSWEEIARAADEGGKPALAEWLRYYFGWG